MTILTRDWRARSACRDIDTEVFFTQIPIKMSSGAQQRMRARATERVKAICVDCPVRTECLRDAFDNDDLHGIRAGFTKKERKKIFAEFRSRPRGRSTAVAQ